MTQHLDKKNNPNHNYDNFSQSESLVEKYYQIYLGLDSKELPNVCYHQNKNNIIGVDIKAEYPKKPHIILHNKFKKNIKTHSAELILKIKKHLN